MTYHASCITHLLSSPLLLRCAHHFLKRGHPLHDFRKTILHHRRHPALFGFGFDHLGRGWLRPQLADTRGHRRHLVEAAPAMVALPSALIPASWRGGLPWPE